VIVGNALMSVTSAVAVLTLNDAAQLGQWYFTTTNWLGQQGQSPVLATNLALTPGWSTNCLLLDTNVPARLVYRDVETNVSTNFYPANIDFHTGSVVWWVKPDWNSTNSGGNGPGNNAVLLMVASTNQTTVNEWWVGISADGGTLTFNTSSNGVATLQGSGPIWWTSNTWHQVVLTYDSNYSYLYVDGYPAADGGGVTNWPARSVTNQGFAVGSDLSGNSQMRGALADLETYNYELGMGDIEDSFETKARRKRGSSKGQAAHEVIYDGNALQFPSYRDAKPIDQARRNAKWLSNYLGRKTGEPVQVVPLVVLPGWFVTMSAKGSFPVRVMNTTFLHGYLQRENEKIEAAQVRRIIAVLDEKCRDMEF
jgi:hypothetical protein